MFIVYHYSCHCHHLWIYRYDLGFKIATDIGVFNFVKILKIRPASLWVDMVGTIFLLISLKGEKECCKEIFY